VASPLDRLRGSSVPTLANALELFGVWPPIRGFTSQPLACHFPGLGMAVGYAATASVSTGQPPGIRPGPVRDREYWAYLESVEGPKLAVVRDLDDAPGGAMWGEWNGNVHKAFGCIGTITHGAVRDLDALDRLGFHVFSTRVSVSHGWGAFVGFGEPVSVAGLTVSSGDLLAADRHGVLRIPGEIPIDELVDVAAEIDRLEHEVFEFCQGDGFNADGLGDLYASVQRRWPQPRPVGERRPGPSAAP
jgi:4-hydroxy-4-methyl-2-oxoglutarate aldolase